MPVLDKWDFFQIGKKCPSSFSNAAPESGLA